MEQRAGCAAAQGCRRAPPRRRPSWHAGMRGVTMTHRALPARGKRGAVPMQEHPVAHTFCGHPRRCTAALAPGEGAPTPPHRCSAGEEDATHNRVPRVSCSAEAPNAGRARGMEASAFGPSLCVGTSRGREEKGRRGRSRRRRTAGEAREEEESRTRRRADKKFTVKRGRCLLLGVLRVDFRKVEGFFRKMTVARPIWAVRAADRTATKSGRRGHAGRPATL